MRGLDGNYINTQGDALTRMQVAYQAEQNRQQIRAQTEAADALRKLREDVNEIEKKNSSGGPQNINDDQGSGARTFENGNEQEKKREEQKLDLPDADLDEFSRSGSHIDIRV